MGDTVRFYSRYLFLAIETRSSWNSKVLLSPQAIDEVKFWLSHVDELQRWSLFSDKPACFQGFIWLDASGTGFGGFASIDSSDITLVHGNWSEKEKSRSSTWRELKALLGMVKGLQNKLEGIQTIRRSLKF